MEKSDIREGIFVRLIETKEKIPIKKTENNTDKSAVSRCQKLVQIKICPVNHAILCMFLYQKHDKNLGKRDSDTVRVAEQLVRAVLLRSSSDCEYLMNAKHEFSENVRIEP